MELHQVPRRSRRRDHQEVRALRDARGDRGRPGDLPLIRAERAGDRDAVRAVIAAAFGGAHVAALSDDLLGIPGGASLVHEVDGVITGHVQLSRSWLDAPQRLVEVLVLSPLSVRPEDQRQGVGRSLVAAAIDEAGRLGAPLLFLEGDPSFYCRSGFLPALEHGFTPPTVRIPGPAFQVVLLPGHEPWMTGALVYADAFWRHDAAGLRD